MVGGSWKRSRLGSASYACSPPVAGKSGRVYGRRWGWGPTWWRRPDLRLFPAGGGEVRPGKEFPLDTVTAL